VEKRDLQDLFTEPEKDTEFSRQRSDSEVGSKGSMIIERTSNSDRFDEMKKRKRKRKRKAHTHTHHTNKHVMIYNYKKEIMMKFQNFIISKAILEKYFHLFYSF